MSVKVFRPEEPEQMLNLPLTAVTVTMRVRVSSGSSRGHLRTFKEKRTG